MDSRKFILVLLITAVTFSIYAQQPEKKDFAVNGGADIASAYIWRGIALGSGAAIQPWGEASYKGFALGTWGSYELKGDFNEVDIYAKYTYKYFTVQFVDLFFPGYTGLNQDYFNLKNSTTGHCSELGFSFNGTEKFPLSVSAGMIMYGVAIDSDPDDATRVNRSTYLELKYSGSVNDYGYNLFAGFTPSKSTLYGTEGFEFINIGATAVKTISVSEKFQVPVKLTLGTNPSAEKIYFTVIISL
jgi:hypothetical protein